MSILLALIIGGGIGTAAAFILKENFNLLAVDIIFGIAGSVFGLLVYVASIGGVSGFGLFDPLGALCMLIGALLFVLLFNGIHSLFPKQITKEGDGEVEEPDKRL
jgi:uncharacterized membrane protein YeaQ/YmgE (transglycosylase-associated protein family)